MRSGDCIVSAQLPKRIRYLLPVIAELDRIPPDELNEDNEIAFSLVSEALRQRVVGASSARAETTLQKDADALNAWLADPGQQFSGAHFISGALLGILGYDGVQQLLGNEPEPPLPPAPCKATLQPPDGFETSDAYTGMVLKKGELMVFIDAWLEAPWTLMIEQPAELLAISGIVESKVRFGDIVRGTTRLCEIHGPVFLKNVGYVLEVPGGWVSISSQSNTPFDEAILEAKLHTLKVVAAS
jgi:hypothetical protein